MRWKSAQAHQVARVCRAAARARRGCRALDHRVEDDHWEQPGNLFRKMTAAQQQSLFENTACAIGNPKLHIKQRHVDICSRADRAYGAGVAKALGIDFRSQTIPAE
jgi:catalase